MATLEEMVDKAIQVAVLRAHPVGSYFITESADNPHEILGGGVWQKLEGRFLLGANASYSVGSEGGEDMHKLTVNEMPSHRHGVLDVHAGAVGTSDPNGYYGQNTKVYTPHYTTYEGGGASHNNMPPYRAVNIWRRTA